MTEKNFSPQDSLQLIQSMIAKTQNDVGNNSTQFLLWGWATFAGFIGQFVLKNVINYQHHYMIWLIVIPTVIASAYIGKREYKKRGVTTYVDESMQHLWTGMAIAFFVLSMIFIKTGWGQDIFPFFMIMYGLGTFLSGKFLQFAPLVYGGIAAWILAIIAIWFNYDYQMLFAAASILVSYLVPAYLLRTKTKSAQ
jgi:hypothetical protein